MPIPEHNGGNHHSRKPADRDGSMEPVRNEAGEHGRREQRDPPDEQRAARLNSDDQQGHAQPAAPEQGHRLFGNHPMLRGEVQEQHHTEGHPKRNARLSIHLGFPLAVPSTADPEADADPEQDQRKMEGSVRRHRESESPRLLDRIDDRGEQAPGEKNERRDVERAVRRLEDPVNQRQVAAGGGLVHG